jgi:hypothetical protein
VRSPHSAASHAILQAMQAPLLPNTADLPAGTPARTISMIIGVKQTLSQLILKATDSSAVLEALASLLEGSHAGNTAADAPRSERLNGHVHAVQRLHYVHLAVKALHQLEAQRAVRVSVLHRTAVPMCFLLAIDHNAQS